MTEDYKRLHWQCRRGMLELDILLNAYLKHCYPQADEAEQAGFRALLETPDPELFAWLIGRTPATPVFQTLIDRIRHAATLSS